jgi:hypothetical protein
MSEWTCQSFGLLTAGVIGVSGVESGKTTAKKWPEKAPEPERQVAERVWFPPDFLDFETAVEVTAYAGRR